MNARTILAIGTGVGVGVCAHDLHVTVVRVRPGGVKVLGSTVITGFRERPAADWGAEYAGFLRRLGAAHLAVTILLPRTEVIVRQLSFPGVADRDLANAILYQIDSLHPYGGDEARYGWARIPGPPAVIIGIVHQSVLERYSQLFLEAGVKIASIAFSATVVHSAVRIMSAPPPEGFVAWAGDAESEIYGESLAHPVFSALVEGPPESAAAMAVSELRLPPETQPLPLAEVLPRPASQPADYDLSRDALPYATALAAACPHLARGANLLPREMRSSSSRMIFVPTLALAAVLLALAAALAAQPALEQRHQLALLNAEIQRYEPAAKKAGSVAQEAELLRGRIELLDGFRRRTRSDLDALNELTRLLEPPAWLSTLEMNRDSIVISGQIEQAAPLLKLLDNSPYFSNSEFQGPLGKADKNEVFRIRTAREGAAR